MIHILVRLSIVALVSSQAPQSAEELRAIVRDASDSALIERVRRSTGRARWAISRLMDAGQTDDSVGRASFDAAARLAAVYATAWSDSYFVRRVARARALSVAERAASTTADSLLSAGNATLKTSGADAAMVILRQALRGFAAVNDTTGMAIVIDNMGIAFFYVNEMDSAEAYFARAFDLSDRTGYQIMAGNAMGKLAIVSSVRGDVEQAKDRYARAKPFRERSGDLGGVAADQHNLGLLASEHGDRATAHQAFNEALATLRSTGELEDAATVLENMGNLARDEGNYAAADTLYKQSLQTFRDRGNAVSTASLLEDLGILATLRGDFPAAVPSYTEAVGILKRIGPTPSANESTVRMRLSLARASMGDLQGARMELDHAETLARRRHGRGGEGTPLSLSRIALARGDLSMTFNRFADAERYYARAYRLASGKNELDAEVRHWAQFGAANVAFRRENYVSTRTSLARLLGTMGDTIELDLVPQAHLLMGQASLRLGDTAAARAAIGRAIDTLHALGNIAGEADALARLGDLEAGSGAVQAAETLYEQGLQRLTARAAPGITWSLHAGLARVLRRRNALADAATQLRAAIGELERVSGGLLLEEHRAAFQADKWDVYIELAQVERARGKTEAAFETSERLRARQMLDLLARGRVAGRQAMGTLAGREQDLRRQMAELSRQIDTASATRDGLRGGEATGAALAQTRAALAQAQDAYEALLLEVRETSPAYAALVRGETAPARDVMQALTPDEALLEYLVGDSTTLVFVVTRDSVTALDLGVSRGALAALVDFARTRLVNPTNDAARRAWRAPLRRLYGQLVGPVEASGLLAGKQRLIVAPHAELHYLPFAALVQPGMPEQLLVERYLIEYVPSASVWLQLRNRPPRTPGGGALALAPRPEALPGSQAEVAAVRRAYGDQARVLVGAPATERAFRTLAPQREVVHLATHGVLNKHNPLFSFVQLGAGGGEDGRLEVHEVYGLSLQARLLVLSACQTGVAGGTMADVPPGDDWVGLVNAFLFAGAANVLGTLWPVQDASTARFMGRFYDELGAGRSEPEALALAQRTALRETASSHPFYWAGFTLVRGN